MINLLKHELLSRWSAVVGWGIGLALFGCMYIFIFPEVAEQMVGLSGLSIYKAMGIEMATFESFIASIVVLFLPILVAVYAIITSTDALAGEEDRGTLELVVAMPLHRWQIVSMKAIAMAVAVFLILAIAGAGSAIALQIVKATTEVAVTPGQLFVVLLGAWPLIMAFTMIGLFLGAFLPNRRIAALVLTVLFVASYFGENLAGMVESLKPLGRLSLFYYFDSSAAVFTEGQKASDVMVLVGAAALFFSLALLSFQRRNVTVGAWPWQRGRVGDQQEAERAT